MDLSTPLLPTQKSAAGYFRFSSDNQNENSIDYQRLAALAYCKSHGLTLDVEYVDEAYSATNDKRPGFQKLIQDASARPSWRIVLVYDLSRFARNAADATAGTTTIMWSFWA